MLQKWKPYPAYKPSGVDWLGDIPAHWKVNRLKFVAQLNPDVMPEETHPDYLISYVDITNVDSRGRIVSPQDLRFEAAPSRARRRVKSGDTILSTVRTYLKAIAFIENPAENLTVSTGFAVLRPDRECEPRFLYRLVQSHEFVEKVVAHSEGVGYPAINPSELAALPVWLPSQPEQRAIAGFLDRETAKVDALVAKKQRLIELLQEKRTALITHAVTSGLNPSAPLRPSGMEWLGQIPEHWEVAPIYAMYDVALGKMLDAKQITGNYLAPYLRNVDVQWDRVNVEDLPEMDFSSEERVRFCLRPGDLVVCEGGEVGRTAMWRGELAECYYQKAIHRLRPLRLSDYPRFFFFVMCAAAHGGVFVAGSNPNTIDHLTAVKLRHYRFPFPPRDEQELIAAFLDEETAKIDTLIGKVREHIEGLKEYRAAVISAAVTGRIDVRGEVAS